MNNVQTYTASSVSETQNLAENIARTLRGGEILTLYGDLGSGKTTFTQGLAHALGIKRNITSPTFIIMRSYQVPDKKKSSQNIRMFYHIDLYRVENEHDLEGLGMAEIFNKKDAIVVVEWPEKLGSLLPEKSIVIRFEYFDEEKRKITINQ